MSMLRILTGLLLAFVVSVVNGVAGLGYTLGGGVESTMQAARDDGEVSQLPWDDEDQPLEPKHTGEPRSTPATVLALMETPAGRFGLGLQALCVLQFIAGALVSLRHRAGDLLAAYLVVVAALGLGAEYAGFQESASWGAFDAIGVVTSLALLLVTSAMVRSPALSEARPSDIE